MEALPVVGFSVWLIVKLFFVIGLIVYTIFAYVIVRQANIMTDTVKMGFEIPIKILALLHLVFALSVLIFSLIIL